MNKEILPILISSEQKTWTLYHCNTHYTSRAGSDRALISEGRNNASKSFLEKP